MVPLWLAAAGCGGIVKLGLNNGATNDAAPESECAAKGGEKSTKVGHSVRSRIGGNLPGKVPPSLSPRSFSICFDFCPRKSDDIWDPISNSSLPYHSHSPHLLSRRRGILLRRNEKHNGPNVRRAAIFFWLFLTDRPGARAEG